MSENKQRRAFRVIVWGGRLFGWALIALALLNAAQTGNLPYLGGSARALSSLVLGFLGVAWIIGLELFLRFFDKFLSRN
jgi:hypothetical protein